MAAWRTGPSASRSLPRSASSGWGDAAAAARGKIPLVSTSAVSAPPGMTWIPGGVFEMGSEDFYPEERPVREASVEGFWMDVHPVTVAAFRRFVKASGYVTLAERTPDAADYPDATPEQLVPGSI